MDVGKVHFLVRLPYLQNCVISFHLLLFISDAFRLLFLICDTEFMIVTSREVGPIRAMLPGLPQIFPSVFLCVQIVR